MEDEPVGKRRRPRQARSRATVDAILDATTLLLREMEPDELSTNRVAERAGVSIGSVYQYFDGRDALLRALLERRREQQMTSMVSAFAEAHTWSIRELASQLVHTVFTMASDDVALQRRLNREMLRLRGMEDIIASELVFAQALVPFFAARTDEVRPFGEPVTAAWLVVHTISSARLSWVMTDGLPEQADADELIGILVDMVSRFLCTDS